MMITTARVAELLKVSETYVRRMCNEKRLRCQKVGRDWCVLELEKDIILHGKGIFTKKKKGKK
jgi:excisionase family DNA binding protein